MAERFRAEDYDWALTYNAYERLAGSPGQLGELLASARDWYESSGQVPDWCGVDLLRGWAFYLARADYFAGGGSLDREWSDVLQALRQHPAAEPSDVPPPTAAR